MGYLDDLPNNSPFDYGQNTQQNVLENQSPAVRAALEQGMGMPPDPRMMAYQAQARPPGRVRKPFAPTADTFSSDAPPVVASPAASAPYRNPFVMGSVADQSAYGRPRDVMMRRR